MPALPWVETHPIEPQREYVAMASRLPLASYRSIPGFLRDTMRIRRQLAGTPGLAGYALDAQLTRKTFWTFSVWDDRESLSAFARSDPHQQITRRLQPRMDESRFEFFTVVGRDVPLAWNQIRDRIEEDPR
jgi:heme-degrading monooxygenase HmoA